MNKKLALPFVITGLFLSSNIYAGGYTATCYDYSAQKETDYICRTANQNAADKEGWLEKGDHFWCNSNKGCQGSDASEDKCSLTNSLEYSSGKSLDYLFSDKDDMCEAK